MPSPTSTGAAAWSLRRDLHGLDLVGEDSSSKMAVALRRLVELGNYERVSGFTFGPCSAGKPRRRES